MFSVCQWMKIRLTHQHLHILSFDYSPSTVVTPQSKRNNTRHKTSVAVLIQKALKHSTQYISTTNAFQDAASIFQSKTHQKRNDTHKTGYSKDSLTLLQQFHCHNIKSYPSKNNAMLIMGWVQHHPHWIWYLISTVQSSTVINSYSYVFDLVFNGH